MNRAHESIEKITFDANEMPSLFFKPKNDSETGQVLIFGSYLEDRIYTLIRSRMLHLQTSKDREIFGSNGPLSTLGNRIALAHQLGWLSSNQKSRLDAFRKIRNEFAHRAFQVSFSDARIASLFANLDYNIPEFLRPTRCSLTENGAEDPFLPDSEIARSQADLCNLAILAERTFSDFLILPAAIAYHVNPNDISAGYNDAPNVLRDLKLALSETIIDLLKRPEN